ncbi:hypothetical protein BRY73_20545 [Ochrobactrum sp. P6BS-III]|nr:hypothetical protein BRY73_20545 [Ochrobactrum sp. P6BS-III]
MEFRWRVYKPQPFAAPVATVRDGPKATAKTVMTDVRVGELVAKTRQSAPGPISVVRIWHLLSGSQFQSNWATNSINLA